MAAVRRDPVTCCCCTVQNESCDILTGVQKHLRGNEDGWYFSACCRCLRGVAVPVHLTVAVLVLQATDCDIGPSRMAAGFLLITLILGENASFFAAKFLERVKVDTWVQTVNFLLEVAALVLLMVVSVNALTWLPSDCNHHEAQSLEVAAAASIIAMLVVQFHLAVNCKTNTRWHSCSIVVTSPDDVPAQEARPELTNRRLLCLVCDVPDGGSILARQAGLTQRLSCLQVLLSLLGWALLLAGCLLLNSNYASPSPLVTAAGAFTVFVATMSVIGGWTGFLGETTIFIQESELGRSRLDRAVLVLTTMLLTLGVVNFFLLLAVAVDTAVDVPETSNSTWVKPGIVSTERSTGANSTSLSDYAVREVRITAYSALSFLLLLLLLAACNNALVCRCQNVRCHDVCSIVLTHPVRAQHIHTNRQRPCNPRVQEMQEAGPLNPPSSLPTADISPEEEPTTRTQEPEIRDNDDSPPPYSAIFGNIHISQV